MATDWVVGIGGTGGKILEVLVTALSLGIGQGLLDGSEPRDLKLFLLDQDQNPWAAALQPALEEYRSLRDRISPSHVPYQPLRRGLQLCQPFPFRPLGGEAGEKSLAYDLLPKQHNEAKAFLPWEGVLNEDIQAGFYGRPALGASVLAWLSSQKSFQEAFLTPLIKDLKIASSQDDQVRVFLVGSAFGGTGSAGLRTLAALLRTFAKEADATNQDLLTIHGIILGPYFAPLGSGAPNWLSTAANKTRCAQVLEDLTLTQPFDSLLLLGEVKPMQIPTNHVAGAGQAENPYHPVELLAACHILDLDEGRTVVDFKTGGLRVSQAPNANDLPPTDRASLENSGSKDINYFVRRTQQAAWGDFPGGRFRKAELEATLAHGILLAREVEAPPLPVADYLDFLQKAWERFHRQFVAPVWQPQGWQEGFSTGTVYQLWNAPEGWPADQEGLFARSPKGKGLVRVKHFELAERLLLGVRCVRKWGKEDTAGVFMQWWNRVGQECLPRYKDEHHTTDCPDPIAVLPFARDQDSGLQAVSGFYNIGPITQIIKELSKSIATGAATSSDRLSYYPTFWAAAQHQVIEIRKHKRRPGGDFTLLDEEMQAWLGLAYGVFMGKFEPVLVETKGNLGEIMDKTSPVQNGGPYYLLKTTLPGGKSIFVGGHDPRGGLWLTPEAARGDCGWPQEAVDLGFGLTLGCKLSWIPPRAENLPAMFIDYLQAFAPIDQKINNLCNNLVANLRGGTLSNAPSPGPRYHPLRRYHYDGPLAATSPLSRPAVSPEPAPVSSPVLTSSAFPGGGFNISE